MKEATWTPAVGSIVILDAPSHWASALVNGDYSSLSDEESAQVRRWLSREGVSVLSVVDGAEPRFTWHYDMFSGSEYKGGEVLAYVCSRVED